MNTKLTVTINSASSLNDLLALLGDVTPAEKKPTSKELREQAGDPVAESTDGGITVYSNGYAVYRNNSGATVVFVPDCKSYSYEFDHHDSIDIKDEVVMDMTDEMWTVAITLRGESQVERNIFDRKGDRGENKGSQAEGEDEENDRIRTSSFPNPEWDYIFREEVKERLSKLTEKEKETIIRAHTYGYTQQEIADYLGVDQSLISRRLTKAENKFGGLEIAELLLSKVV